MKGTLNTIMLFILFATVTISAKQGLSDSDPITLTIIWDTAWSTDQYLADFLSLSSQAISSLEGGDYLELISAQSGKPRLRIAQFVKSADAQEIQNICTLLKNLSCPLLSDARLDDALEMAFTRLANSKPQGHERKVIAIVLSDGRLQDSEAKKICQLSEEFHKYGWQLYLTGAYVTNRNLLVAAGQGRLNWSLISQANPAIWLQKLRQAPESDLEKKTTEPQATQDLEAVKTSQHNIVESAKYPDADAPKYKIETSIDSAVSISEPDKKATAPAHLPAQVNEPVQDFAHTFDEAPPAEPPVALPHAKTGLKKFLAKYLWWVLLTAATSSVLFIAGWFTVSKKADRWKARINSRLQATQSRDPGILTARLNGRLYRLGRLDHFRAIHVGSGPKNTIRITDDSIERRHLKIYKKGGGLVLKNLARSPVTVNSTEVKSRRKHRLILPAVVTLKENVTLNLDLVNQAKPSDKQESKNGYER